MSDNFGALELPVPVPDSNEAAGDPFLDVLLAYLTAVINAETAAAWKQICPPRRSGDGTSLTVVEASAHNPDEDVFVENKLPGLFAWRPDEPGSRAFMTIGWEAVESPVNVLWIPPRPTQDKGRIRQPFRHAIVGAIRKALRRGRHAAWKVVGDDYYEAQAYGSVFLHHAKAMRVLPADFKWIPIWIEDENGAKGTPFRALQATLRVLEKFSRNPADYRPLAHVESTMRLGTTGLTMQTAQYKPTLSSISPASGTLAGGTSITVRGAQFTGDPATGLAVAIDGIACTDVELVDESTITATTPAGVSTGAKTATVTLPSGAQATLNNAFTYV